MIDATTVQASPKANNTPEHRRLGASLRGTFAGVPAPKLVGVSDAVLMSNNDLARRARQAEREWKRSLRRRAR